MADFNNDEANNALEIAIENTKNGNYEEALKNADKAGLMNPELPDIEKLVTLLQVPSEGPGISHYEILGVEETAKEHEIGSAFHKLSVGLNPDTNIFRIRNALSEESFHRIAEAIRPRIAKAMGVLSHDRYKSVYSRDLSFDLGARVKASFEALALPLARHNVFDNDNLFSHYGEPRTSPLEANKDDAIRDQEIAITIANQGEYLDALKFARNAQRIDPDLPKIKKLVASMEILAASSDTTHYKLLGVEETDDATKIRRAYRKLSIDVHPDQNTFPKASEAFKRIVLAARVLSDEESRAKYDHVLAAAREAAVRKSSAQEAAAREVAASEDAATCDFDDAFSGESFSTDTSSSDTSSTDTSYTDASSTDDLSTNASSTDESSTNAFSTDDVGPGSKRAGDAQSISTLHTPKKRREGHGPLYFK